MLRFRIMTFTDDAFAILSDTQERLGRLLADAVEVKDYQQVGLIAGFAEQISKLMNGSDTRKRAVSLDNSPVAPIGTTTTRIRPGSRALPRFERDGDRLVKVAWSKKERAEYEHRAPRQIVFVLLDAIRHKKGEGAVFEAQDILPLIDDGREVPSYQAYLAMAWLRDEGVVTKNSRSGYTLNSSRATSQHIDKLWKALPAR